MEASELRQFSMDELKSRVKQWQDELFRIRFKAQSAEARDTSVFKKLRKDIARGLTILSEKEHGIEVAPPQDQVVHLEGSELAAAAKPAKKTAKSKKGTKKTKKVVDKKGAKTKKAKGVKKHAR